MEAVVVDSTANSIVELYKASGPWQFTDPVRGTWQTDPHKGGTRYLEPVRPDRAWTVVSAKRAGQGVRASHISNAICRVSATQPSETCRHKWPASGWTVRLARAGYRYQPQMGFWVDPPGAAGLGIYGAATGTNRLGQYYCWNRTYDINLGRWTTPDPVATPWCNLFDYVGCSPNNVLDATGLSGGYIGTDGAWVAPWDTWDPNNPFARGHRIPESSHSDPRVLTHEELKEWAAKRAAQDLARHIRDAVREATAPVDYPDVPPSRPLK